ncbi:MAG: magnesium transporter CorA family protein, partial [Sphaerochaetaceae bacterium]
MITIHENYGDSVDGLNTYCWVDARNVSNEDMAQLQRQYNISSDLIADIMDQDEQSRIEKEDEYVDLILRLPILDERRKSGSQNEVPLGIVLLPKMVITICQSESMVLEDFAKNRFRHYPVQSKEGFVISLMGRSAVVFIRLLKSLNREKDLVEKELHRSIMNYELLKLLQIQKSLVYLTTSLTTNEALLERLNKTTIFKLNGTEEQDFLEDTITDNRQAIEMANIYTSILTGTMDCFASVISNNMNVIMKRLTIISISFMFPTFIVSFWGMNIKLPFMQLKWAWVLMVAICAIAALVGILFLSDWQNARL